MRKTISSLLLFHEILPRLRRMISFATASERCLNISGPKLSGRSRHCPRRLPANPTAWQSRKHICGDRNLIHPDRPTSGAGRPVLLLAFEYGCNTLDGVEVFGRQLFIGECDVEFLFDEGNQLQNPRGIEDPGSKQ